MADLDGRRRGRREDAPLERMQPGGTVTAGDVGSRTGGAPGRATGEEMLDVPERNRRPVHDGAKGLEPLQAEEVGRSRRAERMF